MLRMTLWSYTTLTDSAMEESFRDGTDIQIRERSLETSTSANT